MLCAERARKPPRRPTLDTQDCIIIGAGPAGLTAATYLARFQRRVLVVDAGASRARWIPVSHNCPGFPFGVEGNQLLARFRAHAESLDIPFLAGRVESIEPMDDAFLVHTGAGVFRTRNVLMATGIVDRLPDAYGAEEAIASGAMRLCAVCDGYEARDEAIGVYGPFHDAVGHARFLRTFSGNVSILCPDDHALSEDDHRHAREADITVHMGVRGLRFIAARCEAELADGGTCVVDTVYPVLGCTPNTQFIAGMQIAVDDCGKLQVDPHMQTSVPGLFAAGDVVSGLNQVSVAVGHAAIAATAIHRRLPLNRRAPTRQAPASVA